MSAPGIEITPTDTGIEIVPATATTTDVRSDGEGSDGNRKPITSDDIEQLRRELTAAKAERDQRANEAATATTRAAQIERSAHDTNRRLSSEVENRIAAQEATVDSSIASVGAEIDALRSVITRAQEEGKWADSTAAMESMADAKARIRELTYQKQQLAGYRAQVEARANQPPPAPAATTPGVGPKTQAWIAQHPKFTSDPSYAAKAMQGHYAAIAAGIPVESSEYFDMIEKATGDKAVTTNAGASGAGGEGTTPAKTGGSPLSSGAEVDAGVAPVTRRAGGNGAGTMPGKITLTSDEVEAADSMFGEPGTVTYIKDPKERYTYWHTQKARLKTEGRL